MRYIFPLVISLGLLLQQGQALPLSTIPESLNSHGDDSAAYPGAVEIGIYSSKLKRDTTLLKARDSPLPQPDYSLKKRETDLEALDRLQRELTEKEAQYVALGTEINRFVSAIAQIQRYLDAIHNQEDLARPLEQLQWYQTQWNNADSARRALDAEMVVLRSEINILSRRTGGSPPPSYDAIGPPPPPPVNDSSPPPPQSAEPLVYFYGDDPAFVDYPPAYNYYGTGSQKL